MPEVEATSFFETSEIDVWISSNQDRLIGATIYTDRTCHEHLLAAGIVAEYKIIRQDAGIYEAFVRKTLARNRQVVLVRENIADHILQTAEEAVAVWSKIFPETGIEVIAAADILSGKVSLSGKILLCDHHCRSVWDKYLGIAEEPFENTVAKWRCLEDIPCEK